MPPCGVRFLGHFVLPSDLVPYSSCSTCLSLDRNRSIDFFPSFLMGFNSGKGRRRLHVGRPKTKDEASMKLPGGPHGPRQARRLGRVLLCPDADSVCCRSAVLITTAPSFPAHTSKWTNSSKDADIIGGKIWILPRPSTANPH